MGCTKIAPGCTRCYAETLTKNRMGISVWGPKSRRQMTGESIWANPKKWNKQAQAEGRRHRVFCASLCDVFEEFDGPVTNAKQDRLFVTYESGDFAPAAKDLPKFIGSRWVTLDDVRRRLFDLIDQTPFLDWQLLTKRPENIRKMWKSLRTGLCGEPRGIAVDMPFRGNCWLGTSISEQKSADQNIPELLKCRDLAPVLFVSYEPALGPVDFTDYLPVNPDDFPAEWDMAPQSGIDWLIVGGESGPGFRPMDLDWARSARDQCAAAGVPFFFKQSSAIRTEMGIELDGQIVREYPTPRVPGKALA
jgi:protein gp37